jgi:hypothetical protein
MTKIHVRGRDIEEAEFAAEFNKSSCRWRLVGQAEDVFRSPGANPHGAEGCRPTEVGA